MNHQYPLITDSGGFQVFSLAYGSVQREISTQGKELEKADQNEEEEGVKKRRKFDSGNSVIKVNTILLKLIHYLLFPFGFYLLD